MRLLKKRHLTVAALAAVVGVLLGLAAMAADESFRTFDGSDNNVANPTWGVAFQAYGRLEYSGLPNNNGYVDGIESPPRLDNGARSISNILGAQTDFSPDPRGLVDIVNAWGFSVHVNITAGLTSLAGGEPLPIPVPLGDPVFDPTGTGTQELFFLREPPATLPGNPREHFNVRSVFLDGQSVYGANDFRATILRSTNNDGKLLSQIGASGEELLPNKTQVIAAHPGPETEAELVNDLPFHFVSGNLGVNLSPSFAALETVLLREHNRIAEALDALPVGKKTQLGFPEQSDEPEGYGDAIYELARKIVIAEIEAITYNEYLPAIGVQLDPYTGYDETLFPQMFTEYGSAAFRLGHTMLPELIRRIDESGGDVGSLSNADVFPLFIMPSPILTDGTDSILRGMLVEPALKRDTQIIDALRNIDFPTFVIDLLATNLQRGRDRGLPDYNTVRQALGLPSLSSFADLTSDPTLQAAFATAYPDGVDTIDPWMGFMGEDALLGSSFGPGLQAIYKLQLETVRDSDRFWYQNMLTPAKHGQPNPDFDVAFLRALLFIGMPQEIERGPGGLPVLKRSLASLLLDNTGIGSAGFPLTAETKAFFGAE